ncbi:DUF1287 domain-containing protein [Pelagibius marinus]|uniref:DUF1287 domain-containing protein n=1 Tax=Pelagibius marinus TaxID=2762760 RepID=UPI001D057B3B|nr:DUF1287 domain-containing protein [Pelagibius marinus]
MPASTLRTRRHCLCVLAAGLALAALPPARPAAAALTSQMLAARLNAAALARTRARVVYDPAYVRLAYPGGDVPADRGVCADVVIRSYRALGIDLQQLVHEDMRAAFDAYPRHWGLSRPDRNIDHRRVPNLETFLQRQGAALPASDDPADYRPGDLVAWNLRGSSGFLPHIGIVTDQRGITGRPKVVHNIGAGPRLEDVLFNWSMTGHYRWLPLDLAKDDLASD